MGFWLGKDVLIRDGVVLKHREFRLGTGQVIPVLIKAQILEGEAPHEEPEPWMPIIPCAEPPAPRVLL